MTSDDLMREAQDPTTSAARLQEIAQIDRATWPALAAHPEAYDGLLEWLGEHGDDSVRAAISARGGQAPVAADEPPVAAVPVAETEEPVHEPTDEPTQQLPTHEPEPTQQLPVQTPSPLQPEPAVAETSASTPVHDEPLPEQTTTEPDKKNPWLGIAIIAAIVAVIAGGYFAVQALTGDDDSDSVTPSAAATKDGPTSGGDDDEPEAAAPAGDFCRQFADIQKLGVDSFGTGGTPDLSSMKDNLGKMADAYTGLEASAPDDLKADVAKLKAFTEATVAMTEAGGSGQVPEIPDMSDYTDAITHVSTYYATECS